MPQSRATQTSGMPSATQRSLAITESRNSGSLRAVTTKFKFGVERKQGWRRATASRTRAIALSRLTTSIGRPSTQCTSRAKRSSRGAACGSGAGRMPASALCRSRCAATLIGILALERDHHRAQDDVEVKAQRPVAQVVEIVVDARLHLVERLGLAAQAVHLRPAGDAGLHLVTLHVALDELAVGLVVRHCVRARTDDAHASLQHV